MAFRNQKKCLFLQLNSNFKVVIMDVLAWESLPVEVRKYLVQKRMEASDKYQGSATVEKYGIYMKN